MRVCGPSVWGPPKDRARAHRVLRRAIELGVDFFDTADSYGPAAAETLVADALHPYDGLVVATKAGLTRQGPGRWSRDARPQYLRDACHASLERLRVERIDLFQLHAVDPAVPIEDSLGALSELRAEGKIRHVGVCNVDADQLGRALVVEPIVSVQNRFSLADRSSRDVLDVCQKGGLAFIPWAPLAKGTLTRAQRTLDEIAHAHDATPGQVALAWILAISPATLPIPGTSSVAHIQENAGASRLRLSADDLHALERTAFAMPTRGRSSRRALHRLTRLVRR
jgi:aryl-alcohol dehydrogenase-like predicted oxidoreductase